MQMFTEANSWAYKSLGILTIFDDNKYTLAAQNHDN